MPLHRRLPKIGFSNQQFRTSYQVVNVGEIQKAELQGDVGPEQLVAAGLARKSGAIKILGDGELTSRITLTAHAISRSAREKVEAAGGSFVVHTA